MKFWKRIYRRLVSIFNIGQKQEKVIHYRNDDFFVDTTAMIKAMDIAKSLNINGGEDELIRLFQAKGLFPAVGNLWTGDDIEKAAKKYGHFQSLKNVQNLAKNHNPWIGRMSGLRRTPILIIGIVAATFLISRATIPESRLEKQINRLNAEVSVLKAENERLRQTQMGSESVLPSQQPIVKSISFTIPPNSKNQSLFKKTDWIPNNRATPAKITEKIEPIKPEMPAKKTSVDVKKGDSVWKIISRATGKEPTVEQIKKVVENNQLSEKTNERGDLIVLIFPGQAINLACIT